MNKILTTIAACFLILISSFAHADYDPKNFRLMLDQEADKLFQDLPKNTRFLGKKLEKNTSNKSLNLTGLEKLSISGSAQFTKHQLGNLITKILNAKSQTKKIFIIDLRQESHGFLGNLPFRFYAKDNAINKDIPIDKIDEVESYEISKLDSLEVLNIFSKNENEKPISLEPENIKTEKEIVEFYQSFLAIKNVEIEYVRFHLQDHHFVHDDEMHKLKELLSSIDFKDTWIHFHCAGGKGRTTSFMIMTDMFFNKHNIPFEHYLMRHSYIGGSDFIEKKKSPKADTRYDDLLEFYNGL